MSDEQKSIYKQESTTDTTIWDFSGDRSSAPFPRIVRNKTKVGDFDTDATFTLYRNNMDKGIPISRITLTNIDLALKGTSPVRLQALVSEILEERA